MKAWVGFSVNGMEQTMFQERLSSFDELQAVWVKYSGFLTYEDTISHEPTATLNWDTVSLFLCKHRQGCVCDTPGNVILVSITVFWNVTPILSSFFRAIPPPPPCPAGMLYRSKFGNVSEELDLTHPGAFYSKAEVASIGFVIFTCISQTSAFLSGHPSPPFCVW